MSACAGCGYNNVPGTLFCEECGLDLTPEVVGHRAATGDISSMAAHGTGMADTARKGAGIGTGDFVVAASEDGDVGFYDGDAAFATTDDEHAALIDLSGTEAAHAAPYDAYAPPPAPQRVRPPAEHAPIAQRTGRSAGSGDLGSRPAGSGDLVGSAPAPEMAHPAPANQPSAPRRTAGLTSSPAHQPAAAVAVGAYLICESGRRIDVPAQDVVIVGREDMRSGIRPDVDLTLDGASAAGVSRRHCRLLRQPDGWYAEDLMSTNFTVLNGKALTAHTPARVQDGDELRLGKLRLRFHEAS